MMLTREQVMQQLANREAELKKHLKDYFAIEKENATLRAKVEELEGKLKYHDLFKQWQLWRDPDELVAEYEKYQAAQARVAAYCQEVVDLQGQVDKRDEQIASLNSTVAHYAAKLAALEGSSCD